MKRISELDYTTQTIETPFHELNFVGLTIFDRPQVGSKWIGADEKERYWFAYEFNGGTRIEPES